jgi:hypothetical protein
MKFTLPHTHTHTHNTTQQKHTQKGAIQTTLYGKKRPEFNFYKFISATRAEMRLQKAIMGYRIE